MFDNSNVSNKEHASLVLFVVLWKDCIRKPSQLLFDETKVRFTLMCSRLDEKIREWLSSLTQTLLETFYSKKLVKTSNSAGDKNCNALALIPKSV